MYQDCKYFMNSTVKLDGEELFWSLQNCLLKPDCSLFMNHEVNWQIGHGKWFNITKLFTI